MTRITLPLAFALLVSSLLSAAAHAQTFGRTVVLPHASVDPGPALRAADAVESTLTTRRVPVIPMHDARDRFVAHSRPPSASTDSDVDVLAREARAALEHVAFGRSAAAERSVREVLSRAERALDSLNRQTSTARQVLDACLALVRSALQHDDRREAVLQAMACRRLVPDVAPNENLHPASVIGVLAEADDQLRRLRIGRLNVLSAPESGCSVYLNGRHLGTTPFLLERAAAGEYRVQVECGDTRGRVHVIQLGEEPVDLVVDTRFDTAIESEPRLLLRYPTAERERELVLQHAAIAGSDLKVDDVVLVGMLSDYLELMRVSVRQGRIVGRTKLAWDGTQLPEREKLDRALDVLAEGRIEGEPSAVTTPVAVSAPASVSTSAATSVGPVAQSGVSSVGSDVPTSGPAPVRPSERNVGLTWAGGALAVTGAAAYAVGVGFEVRARKLDDEIASLAFDDPQLASKGDDFDRASTLRWVGVGGGVLGTMSVPMLARGHAGVPWWSWTLGGAGVALVGVGAWQIAAADDCELREDDGTCFSTQDTEARGALIMAAGAPLLALPFTHLVKRTGVDAATAGLELTPGRFVATLTLAR